MDFASALGQAAKKSGMTETQGVSAESTSRGSVKAETTESFGALLGAAKSKAPVAPTATVASITGQRIPVALDELGDVPRWSFSTLKEFETCQYAVKLKKVDKIPSESGPAAERGSLIHDGCEQWVRFEREDFPADAKTKFEYFTDRFEGLREAYREGRVLMEENWGIRKDWSPCEWDDDELWGRAKLDVFVLQTSVLSKDASGYVAFNESGELILKDGRKKPRLWDDMSIEERSNYSVTCLIIDYKTGRKFGNEMKHSDQGLSYALHAMYRFPDINAFEIEFWYIDQADKLSRLFNRRQLLLLLNMYNTRALKLTSCTNFMPSPNAHTCVYCSYGSNRNKAGAKYGNGACQYDHYRGMGDDDE